MAADPWMAWTLIAGLAIVSFATRAIFILPGSHLRLPPTVERVLRFAPAAALAAIIVPDIVRADSGASMSFDAPRLLAGVVALGVAWATRNIVPTIAAGMLVLAAARMVG